VWCARDVVGNEPFAVLLPDVLIMGKPGCLKQMMDAYAQVGGNIIAVDEVPLAQVHQYGVIDPAEKANGPLTRMKGMVEKPKADVAPSALRITGRYILQPEVMHLLATQNPGAGGEIQLTDAMARLMQDQPFHAHAFNGRSYDCGDKVGYVTATAAFALASETLSGEIRAALHSELQKSQTP
jgi:UTP--glucose-1-phosphate uridylyltransferase